MLPDDPKRIYTIVFIWEAKLECFLHVSCHTQERTQYAWKYYWQFTQCLDRWREVCKCSSSELDEADEC